MDLLNQTITPGWNASLNGLAGVLIILGYIAIKGLKNQPLHKALMVAAVLFSAIFLSSYLYYHFIIKGSVSTSFRAQNPDAPAWAPWVYYPFLITHIILAIVVTPMVLITAYRGLKNQLSQHIRLARWTLPIWLYVSVSGVMVYWMLYRLF